jgi:hypothetical protein
MGQIRNTFNILVIRSEMKIQHGKPRRRWEDFRKDLRKTGWEGGEWMYLDRNRDQWRAVVKKVLNIRVPKNAGNFLTS